MRRETSRVSFLLCPFSVRAPTSVLATRLRNVAILDSDVTDRNRAFRGRPGLGTDSRREQCAAVLQRPRWGVVQVVDHPVPRRCKNDVAFVRTATVSAMKFTRLLASVPLLLFGALLALRPLCADLQRSGWRNLRHARWTPLRRGRRGCAEPRDRAHDDRRRCVDRQCARLSGQRRFERRDVPRRSGEVHVRVDQSYALMKMCSC